MKFPGSLLKDGNTITSSWDVKINNTKFLPSGLSTLTTPNVFNYAIEPFEVDYREITDICVLNGMGVTLGDSIIGISALHAMTKINPNIKITLIRPQSLPHYVNEVYALARSFVHKIANMPVNLRDISTCPLVIDMGNQLYRPSFSFMEMHDFFLQHLGINPTSVCEKIKSNIWLKENFRPEGLTFPGKFVLLNTGASTPLREIPDVHVRDLIDFISDTHRLPVCGFSDIMHKNYTNISSESRRVFDYINIISQADYLYTSDSSAVHIAAAFNIPTTCFFNAIPPTLRSLYYKHTHSVYMGTSESRTLHKSDSDEILQLIRRNYENYFTKFRHTTHSVNFMEYNQRACRIWRPVDNR